MSTPVVHRPFATVDTVPQMAVGTIVWDFVNAKAYKYVKFLDAVAYLAGHVVQYANTACTSVSNDVSGGTTIGTGCTNPAGLCLAVQTENSYGFIQIAGVGLAYGDGSVAAGEVVVADTGADGRADTMAAGEEHQAFGVAQSTDDTANDPLGATALFYVKLRGLI